MAIILTKPGAQAALRKSTAVRSVAGFGGQIRSYVLDPYKQVKDSRTGLVSNDIDSILDGEIDQFIEAELARRMN